MNSLTNQSKYAQKKPSTKRILIAKGAPPWRRAGVDFPPPRPHIPGVNLGVKFIAELAVIVLIVLGLLVMPSYAEEWNVVDKGLMASFVVGQVLNTGQVLYLYNEPGWRELNPIVDGVHDEFGDSGVIAYKVLGTLVVYLVADRFPRYRRGILLVANFIVVGVVMHDIHAGVGWRF